MKKTFSNFFQGAAMKSTSFGGIVLGMIVSANLLTGLLIGLLIGSVAGAAPVEFACGTAAQGGSFYSETGQQVCETKGAAPNATALTADSKAIFCFYNATCTPVTHPVRQFLMQKLDVKTWSDLGDDEINHALIQATMSGSLPAPLDLTITAVQCLGEKSADGTPSCPKVNACINNRGNRALYWKMQPLNVFDAAKGVKNSDGFRLKQEGQGVPESKPKGTVR